MLIAIIIISSDAYSQSIKRYCFDSTDVAKINKIIAERDYLVKDISQYERLDSINILTIKASEDKINNLDKIIIENNKIINELEARPTSIINNAKWYYIAESVIVGIIAGSIITLVLK